MLWSFQNFKSLFFPLCSTTWYLWASPSEGLCFKTNYDMESPPTIQISLNIILTKNQLQ